MDLTLKGCFVGEYKPVESNPTISISEVKLGEFRVNPINIKIKLEEGGELPCKAHDTDAGYDIYANMNSDKTEDVKVDSQFKYIAIPPHETRKISAGFSTSIPNGYVGHIYPRSGLSTKEGLRMANCVSTIDAPYRGIWLIPVHNDSSVTRYIKHGERIAQFTIDPVLPVNLMEVDELDETDRNENGFGSSGRT